MGNIVSASRDVTCNLSTRTVNSFVGAGLSSQSLEPQDIPLNPLLRGMRQPGEMV
jgi:hypothetical protein